MECDKKTLVQQGIDSKAMLTIYITKLPVLILLAAAGAILCSGLNLLIALTDMKEPVYVSVTKYYIEFSEGRYEARDYYNAFTWNDAIGNDEILGRAMERMGSGYDRSHVRDMITAEILSDVRYLTITVRGQNPSEVEVVKNAIGTALEEFGTFKKEFESIYKIEDLEIVREEKQYFTGRASFLGAVLFAGAGIFVIALTGSAGSVFYTKNDIIKILEVPVCGLTFAKQKGNRRDKEAAGFIKRQHGMLRDNMNLLLGKYKKIVLMDASGGQYAELFLQYVKENHIIDVSGIEVCDSGSASEITENTMIIAVIPFGKSYREKITDEINCAKLHGGKIAAAVLVNADRIWMKIYYAG